MRRRVTLAAMADEIIVAPASALATELATELETARRLLKPIRSKNTEEAYERDWKQFCVWAAVRGFPALPADPQTVVRWISHLCERNPPARPSTIARKIAVVNTKHREVNLDPPRAPAIQTAMKNARRELGTKQRQAGALMGASLPDLLSNLGDSLRDVRDRAIVLVGWQAAARRSELAGIEVNHLDFVEGGVTVSLPKSKTNQEGEQESFELFEATKTKDPKLCPVAALKEWLRRSGIESGHVFREVSRDGKLGGPMKPERVRSIVKRLAPHLTAHSLRVGFVTTSKLEGRHDWEIAMQTRHKSPAMIRRYTRAAEVRAKNAAKGLL